ncbi:MAG TPA: molybdopterin-dependent oxidoreductase [Bryobacteraceae bacterium]
MDRRNFFKILSTVSAGAAATSCGDRRDALAPMLVPEHEIVPGEEQWHPAVCRECSAACGTIARVMEGVRTVERNGQTFRERVAAIKKLEGNPLDPVSGGRLCARGQAAVQSLYHPDRVRGPMRRTGARGEAKFTAISWEEAITSVAGKLAGTKNILFLTAPEVSARTANVARFLQAMGAPPARTCSPVSSGLPRYDLARARFVLGVGVDFLGTWASPVYYMRQYGAFRQGREGVRGKFVQAESRMSLTASNADEWIPIRPGSEEQFLAALVHVLKDESDPSLTALMEECGITEKRLRRVARALKESEAPLVVTDSPAGLYVNSLLGNLNKPGGVFAAQPSLGTIPQKDGVLDALKNADVLLVDSGENPFYLLPRAPRQAAAIVSFASIIDDTAAYADFILPAHHTLESDTAVEQPISPLHSIAVTQAFVRPLYNTRALEQTLTDLAKKMNVAYSPVTPEEFAKPLLSAGQSWDDIVRRGGVQAEGEAPPLTASEQATAARKPVISGDAQKYPLVFQTYLSMQYYDGRGADLPWMQELPDPASSAMWDLPVEIDVKTAAGLRVETGDRVRLESEHGTLEAFAYVHPAGIPGVASMAMGQGHSHYGRYASGRGANPLSIAAPEGLTRVRITRIANKAGELAQFSPKDREQGPWGYR